MFAGVSSRRFPYTCAKHEVLITSEVALPEPKEVPHVLVVDDDARLRDLLSRYLGDNGFSVTQACDAADARTRLERLSFDAIVLDIMMPGETGLSFAASFRKTDSTPILMLTAMSEPENRIDGLETGADDYLVKPFEPRELLLRLQNIVKRQPTSTTLVLGDIQLGTMTFDTRHRCLIGEDGNPVSLTENEVGLLTALCANPGLPMAREELVEVTAMVGDGRAVDVQITRLRRKLEVDPKIPRYLQTVRGRGYMLVPD